MPTTLTALGCTIATNSITITFSEPVDSSVTNLANYTVYDPPNHPTPTPLTFSGWQVKTTDGLSVTLTPSPSLQPGDFVLLNISGITAVSGSLLLPTDLSGQVPFSGKKGRIVRDVEDAISYPILTEEISNRPFSVSTFPSSGSGGGAGSSSIGQLASRTVTDVLGWKLNPADPKGFIGALTQAFTLNNVEGHVESKWNPQMAAIQTDLGGSITGAQASLYTRAKDAMDQANSLLDTLYPLDPEADPEYVKALRELVRSQMTQIVRELAVIGLPSVLRIDTYFAILLGQSPAHLTTGQITFNPDQVEGTLGKLRDTYGIQFAGNPFNNSVADEVVITNFRVISDYLTSLMQSWISNRDFFFVRPGTPAFFGTQLVLISRQFNVIAETVNEMRFTLDSVFIGPAERQALLLVFADTALPPRFLEGMLIEIEAFVGQEAPQLLKDGGKITVTNNILPVTRALLNMVEEAHNPTNIDELPDGFKTARVRNSLDDLRDQLERLVELVEQVEQEVPLSEDKLLISGLMINNRQTSGAATLELFGDGIQPGIIAVINSTTAHAVQSSSVTFYSAQRVDIFIDPKVLMLEDGRHDITLTNPNGDSVIVEDAFSVSGGTTVGNPQFRPGAASMAGGEVSKRLGRQKPGRKVSGRTGGGPGPTFGRRVPPSAPPAVAAMMISPAAAPVASPRPGGRVENPVQNLSAAQGELTRKVNAQTQEIAAIDKKIDNVLLEIKNMFIEQGKTLDQKLEQQGKQQQEQFDEKIRHLTPKPGK
jgi:Bacterial Ig-like domain